MLAVIVYEATMFILHLQYKSLNHHVIYFKLLHGAKLIHCVLQCFR